MIIQLFDNWYVVVIVVWNNIFVFAKTTNLLCWKNETYNAWRKFKSSWIYIQMTTTKSKKIIEKKWTNDIFTFSFWFYWHTLIYLFFDFCIRLFILWSRSSCFVFLISIDVSFEFFTFKLHKYRFWISRQKLKTLKIHLKSRRRRFFRKCMNKSIKIEKKISKFKLIAKTIIKYSFI